jgi:seryl-tRNA synthetase
MKELKKRRDEMLAERDDLEASIPSFRATWEQMPQSWDHRGNCVGSPEKTAAMEALCLAEASLRSIPDELVRLDRDISYYESLASAKQAKAKAQKVMKDSADSVATLETTHKLVSERLAAIQTETDLAIKRAQQVELDAANLYARSVTTGNSEGERTASHDMTKASEMLIECDEHARRQDLIVTALQTEIDALDAQLAAARNQRSEAQNDALAATALGLSEEWNRVANQLVVLGSKILAANDKRGVRSWALEELAIPLFGALTRKPKHDDILDCAKGISLADLIEA